MLLRVSIVYILNADIIDTTESDLLSMKKKLSRRSSGCKRSAASWQLNDLESKNYRKNYKNRIQLHSVVTEGIVITLHRPNCRKVKGQSLTMRILRSRHQEASSPPTVLLVFADVRGRLGQQSLPTILFRLWYGGRERRSDVCSPQAHDTVSRRWSLTTWVRRTGGSNCIKNGLEKPLIACR